MKIFSVGQACLQFTFVAAISLLTSFTTSTAGAQESEPFKGKPIIVYVGTGAGGIFDFYGRLVAKHLSMKLPGRPNVIVQNMPGAGGVRMANFLFHQAPKDGTAIAIPLSTIALLEAAGFAGVQYRTTDFTWLGRLSANLDITIIRKGSGIANLEDARTRQVVIAGATNGSGASIDPQGLNAFAGTKFKIISGYESSSAGLLAFERGEVDGATTTWDTLKRTHSKWLKDGIVDIIVQYGETRNKQLPDVPASAEFAKDARSRKLLALYSPGAMVGTALIAPPGIPEDVANLLRKAVDEIATDKSYLSELSVIGTEPTDVLTGAAMQDKLKEGMALRPEDTAAVKAAFH